ncbi:hypothetical protein TIFTF001_012443 [Ficus carica]|uniref:Uncharacterized protein n=1 Tax=Ficus carica TaxID=3494 RepID=A0AA88D3Q1_FICCA|nr:hypothetical protein TIFTF001_012443 [Ficus carica]
MLYVRQPDVRRVTSSRERERGRGRGRGREREGPSCRRLRWRRGQAGSFSIARGDRRRRKNFTFPCCCCCSSLGSGFWTGRRKKANPKELEDLAGTNGEDATPPSLTTLAIAGTQ